MVEGSFLSICFFPFLLLLLGMLSVTRDDKSGKIFLLVAGYIFYGFADVRFLILLMMYSAWIWYIGHNIDDNPRGARYSRIILIIGVISSVITLGIFKYMSFFIDSYERLFNQPVSGTLRVIIPLGISFYILQGISYIVDVLLYISFFPCITAGPIIKARDFFSLLCERKRLDKSRLSYAVQLLMIGLFKKIVIADRIGVGVDAVYNAVSQYSGLSLLFNSFAYSIQIYCDFSGYSDMAIAIAYLLGFDLEPNFDLPYIASNPSEFWKRWHISLSSWLTEYVYIPLGGNRKGKYITYINLMLVMLVSGIWHGASLNFIVWGLFHGILLILYRMIYPRILLHTSMRNDTGRINKRMIKYVGILLTVGVSWFCWIPFRAETLGDAILTVRRIVLWEDGITYISVFGIIYGVLIIVSHVVLVRGGNGHRSYEPLDTDKFVNKVILCVFALLIICFAYFGDTAFIYANF